MEAAALQQSTNSKEAPFVEIEHCNEKLVDTPLTDFLSPRGLGTKGMLTLNSEGILVVHEGVEEENCEESAGEENEADELILMDEAEQAEREIKMAGSEDA